MSDDQIEFSGRRLPIEHVGIDEADAARRGFAFGDGEHAPAGIEHRDFGVGELALAGWEKSAVALAQQEDATGRRNFIDEREAAALEFSACGERFHRPIERGESVEIHRGM